ncbi:small glutamine-rich tetratricopeptide repeat-containing protein-like [Phlebotomus argentipes]|uniref:small glutamine-rich tetratricopeptide repeat-containing protein-like n=1 Tax=Phlebotomus argentipes TaxID=94469 RepID=UPI0028936157|nr:small glutamine-rich tetratricopeptide repeat-containing protein-like [Phlebotomus argentipes]
MVDAEKCPDPDVREPTAEEIKEQGNQCVRAGNYKEAILHYSQAIKMTPNPDATLFSNRSLAFLKVKLYYYANEDADRAIQLRPDWAKGYFRRGEVQTAAGHYDTALLAYGRALQLQPNDITIINAAQKVANLSSREAKMAKRLPWMFVAAGTLLGVLISLADTFLAEKPSLAHPAVAFLLTLALALLGYGGYRMYRYMVNMQKKGNLEAPVDLLEGFEKQEDVEDPAETGGTANRNRYSKAQARQRFRKGKS